MRRLPFILIVLFAVLFAFATCSNAKIDHGQLGNGGIVDEETTYEYVDLSVQLLNAARYDKPHREIGDKLANASLEELEEDLSNDRAKKAFWLNVYNAYVQLILGENPELFENRSAFFGKDRITVAGEKLSFDEIEHGLIRGSKIKLALGLIKDPFVGKFERKLRVSITDGRIHFALNCGAKSCPYVAVYKASKIDAQLDETARQYLNKTSTYNSEEGKVYVTSLFSWFRGDFGGKSGIRKYLKKYDVIPGDAKPALEFKEYDWTLELGNYKDLNIEE